MKAEDFLDVALGGNTNVATLTFLSLTELLKAYTKALEAENATLKEENKALEEIRRIAESYVSAPPQVRGGVFRNLDKKLLALSGKMIED